MARVEIHLDLSQVAPPEQGAYKGLIGKMIRERFSDAASCDQFNTIASLTAQAAQAAQLRQNPGVYQLFASVLGQVASLHGDSQNNHSSSCALAQYRESIGN